VCSHVAVEASIYELMNSLYDCCVAFRSFAIAEKPLKALYYAEMSLLIKATKVFEILELGRFQ